MAGPPAKRPRLGLTETIIFRVGKPQERQDYAVHKSFATKSSHVIQGFLKNRENAQPNCNKPVGVSKVRPADFEVHDGYGTTLVRLYILAEYLKDERFSEEVFEIIAELCEDKSMVFESAAVRLVWRNLPRNEVLRTTFLEAMLASFLGKPGCAKFIGSYDWPMAVSVGIIMAALQRRQNAGFFCGEDSSEVGEALTSLLGPVDEQF